MSELDEFRKEKDDFFATSSQSPLTTGQKRHFNGLNYFPENPDLRLEIELEEYPDKEEITMQTTTGDVQTYERFGKFQFDVDGQSAELTIYASSHDFFLPFVDSLAGTETYPAGRYLEPVQLPDGSILVDFNYAYNPYCAYNEYWSCPITPGENRIKVPVRAGEKIYHQE